MTGNGTESQPHLVGSRVVLRRARASDLEAIHAIMSDAEVMRYWSTPPHSSLDVTQLWFASMLSPTDDADEFVIEHRGAVIGKMGAWKMPEIGYFLRRDHWGRGFASEALSLFAEYAASVGWPHLMADVDPLNTASLSLLDGAGFRETGREKATYVVGGRVCDSIYLQLNLSSHSVMDEGAMPV